MKSQGILSRYVRPGYSRGQYVQEAKKDDIGGGIRDYDKKRREFFRNPNLVLFKRTRKSDDNPYDYEVEELDVSQFDPKKVKDGTQLIIQYSGETGELIPGTGFDGSIGLEDAPFLFYSSPGDVRKLLDSTDYDDMIYGKPFADDATFLDKVKERTKMMGRGIVGFAKNLPEMSIGAYRFLQPIDALGGIGPVDTLFPKSEEQKKQVDEMYEFPGYSNLMREKYGIEPFQTPKGVFGGILDADESLYKDTLVDDRMKAGLMQQRELYDVLQMYGDDELRAELEEEGASPEEIQEYFDIKNMTEEDFKDLKYYSDRDALSHDIPGAFSSIAGTLPLAAGPLGVVGQGANLISKGNRLSQMISKLRKPAKVKALDAGVGTGVIPGSLEALGREVIPSVTDKFE
tara:strand:+ start:906 stop:2108 length:1203 start_codon:yes stop_codon:yes gene_type:complete